MAVEGDHKTPFSLSPHTPSVYKLQDITNEISIFLRCLLAILGLLDLAITVGVHSLNVERKTLLGGLVSLWGELDDRVKWHLDVREVLERVIHVVGKDGAKHSLVSYNQDVSLPLQLHNNGLQSQQEITVGLQRERGNFFF